MTTITLNREAVYQSPKNLNCGKLIVRASNHIIRQAGSLPKAHSTATLNKPRVRVAVIIGSVIALSLAAALCGCVIASRRRKRRKVSEKERKEHEGDRNTRDSAFVSRMPSEGSSSEEDIEMLAALDTIMANSIFQGREWSAYQREMRAKAERQARGMARTSQGVPLPISVQHLKSRMRDLSRSLLRSLTRSEAAQSPCSEPRCIDEVLTRSGRVAKSADNSTGCTEVDVRHKLETNYQEEVAVVVADEVRPGQ